MFCVFVVGIVLLVVFCVVLVIVMVELIKGDVFVNSVLVFQGQFLFVEQNIIIGLGGQIVLCFDDGMQVVVNENSCLCLVDYCYNRGLNDCVVFDFFQGVVCVFMGQIVCVNFKQFFFCMLQVQFGVQGLVDFVVVFVNFVFLMVNVGIVFVSNGVGIVVFGVGVMVIVVSFGVFVMLLVVFFFLMVVLLVIGNLQVVGVVVLGGVVGGVVVGIVVGGIGLGIVVFVVFMGVVIVGVVGVFDNDDGFVVVMMYY